VGIVNIHIFLRDGRTNLTPTSVDTFSVTLLVVHMNMPGPVVHDEKISMTELAPSDAISPCFACYWSMRAIRLPSELSMQFIFAAVGHFAALK